MSVETPAALLESIHRLGLVPPDRLAEAMRRPVGKAPTARSLGQILVDVGGLTAYQLNVLVDGEADALKFGEYRVLEPAGTDEQATRELARSVRGESVVLHRFHGSALADAGPAGDAVLAAAREFAGRTPPHLTGVLDGGWVSGRAFVATAPPTGVPAPERVRAAGPMPVPTACRLLAPVARALGALHMRGYCHGAVTPDALFLTHQAAELAGLGARLPLPPPMDQTMVSSAPPAGLAYLPPERLERLDVRPEGDVYGLACVLALLLTGRPPFPESAAHQVVVAVENDEPAILIDPPDDLPPSLLDALRAALEKSPADRPTAGQFAVSLDAHAAEPGDDPDPSAVGLGEMPTATGVPLAALTSTGMSPPEMFDSQSLAVPAADPLSGPIHAGVQMADPVSFTGNSGAFVPPGPQPYVPPTYVPPGAFHAPPEPGIPYSDAGDAANEVGDAAADAQDAAPRPPRAAPKRNTALWLAGGAVLHLSAMGLLGAYLLGLFDKPAPKPEPPAKKKRSALVLPAGDARARA